MSSPSLAKIVRSKAHGGAGVPKRTNTMPSNMMTVLSRIKVDIPPNQGKGRRRPGSTRYSYMSSVSQESEGSKPAFVDVEEEFLHAAEFGDIPNVRRILEDYADINVDCIDALGRTALRLAVKNEHLEVVEVLLEKSNQHHIQEAVLQAISAGHTQIAETILKHRRYLEMWKERRKLGDTDGFYKTAFPDSQFSPDITPLILASQKNQYEIVQLLLLRGETIMKPHKFSCACQECRNKMKFDQLRLAKYRLNAYKGLASEAYISLSSKDPILTAFELAAELRRLSRVEKHFKSEYRELADQLSDYVVKLLDRIRTQKELELVLNKTGKPHQEKFDSLARFKLALKYKEKKFVAHPSCQQRLVRLWYNGMGKLERATWPKRLTMIALFLCAYPFLIFLHVLCPNTKAAKILQYPALKFVCNAMSFFTFLLLIVVSTIESSQTVSKYRTLRSVYPDRHYVYTLFCNATAGSYIEDLPHDFPLRPSFPTITELLLTAWIIGMVFQECSQLFHHGLMEHLQDFFNLLDILLITTYIATFTLRFWTMYKFHASLAFLSYEENIANERKMLESIYWLNTDRLYWSPTDPINFLEGSFAVANILSVARIAYLLPANEILGPLQISLGRMLKDIAKICALLVVVIFAFMVGLHNLYWYYDERDDIELDYPGRPIVNDVNAQENFGGVIASFRTVFWAMFGRGEPDAVKLGGYNNTFTADIGYFIYGMYNIAMVTVLLNMLIAMMTRSFDLIAEDSDREWKFSRSLLYMDYISYGGTLPVPINIIGAPKAFFKMLFCGCCCCGEKHPETEDLDEDIEDESPMYSSRNRPIQNGRGHVGKQGSLDDPRGYAHHNNHHLETTEVNGKVNEAFDGTPTKPSRKMPATMVEVEATEDKLTYQQTMQRIVQRYIFDIQREAEVTEDDFDEIKQDLSSFRYDLLNQMANKNIVEEELKAQMATILAQLQSLNEELLGKDAVKTVKNFEKKADTSRLRPTDLNIPVTFAPGSPEDIDENPETINEDPEKEEEQENEET
ncbi:short transient receptor potential channel 3 [Biomphalaria glabrata]|nr:short transient receptor potential channel 3 [Biomphalaria glabrata]